MGAYSERDGIPNCADEFLLTELLRDVCILTFKAFSPSYFISPI